MKFFLFSVLVSLEQSSLKGRAILIWQAMPSTIIITLFRTYNFALLVSDH